MQAHRTSRRGFLAVLGTAALGALAVACGGQQQAAAPTAAPTAAAKAAAEPTKAGAAAAPAVPPTPTTQPGIQDLPAPKAGQKVVKYWHYFGAGLNADVHTKQIKDFLDKNPNYAIEATFVTTTAGTQLSEKLLAAISGGDPPDAARFDRFIVTSWAARGFLTDLSAKAQADKVTQDKFIKEGWLEATYKNKLYAVPFDTDLRGLYWNKKHFQEVGLDPNKPPTTIEELDAMAEKLYKKDGAKYSRIGFAPWVGQGSLYTWAWIFGGDMYDPQKDEITLDNPKVVKALEWMVSYAKKYDVNSIDSVTASFGANEQQEFVTGTASLISQGDWQVASYLKYMKPEQKDDWDVVPYPKAQGGPEKVTWGGGWSTVVPKGAKEVDGAWAFSKHLGTDAAAIYAIETTHIPVYLPAYDDLEKNKDKFDPRWRKFWPLKEVARFRPNLPVGQELWTAQSTAADLARHLKEEPAAVLKRLNGEVSEAYKKYKG
jgi:ABC-type glycerol-3-phosphate transport system substrate-binding protein